MFIYFLYLIVDFAGFEGLVIYWAVLLAGFWLYMKGMPGFSGLYIAVCKGLHYEHNAKSVHVLNIPCINNPMY